MWSPALIRGLTLQAGAGLLHTSLGSFPSTTSPTGIVAAGNRLPNAPSLTFNGQARYDIPLGDERTLRLAGSAHYSASEFKDALNDPLLFQRSYWSFDGRVSLIAGNWEAALWGRNLSDERHLVQGVNLLQFGYGNRSFSAPRTFGVSVSRRW